MRDVSGQAIPALVATVLLPLVGLIAFAAERRSREAQWFALYNMLLGIANAAGAIALLQSPIATERVGMLARVGYGTTAAAFGALYAHIATIARSTNDRQLLRVSRLLPLLVSASVFFGAIAISTRLLLADCYWTASDGFRLRFGTMAPILLIVTVPCAIWTIWTLGAVARKSTGRRRSEVIWIGIGVVLFDWSGLVILSLALPLVGFPTTYMAPAPLVIGSVVMLAGMVLVRQQALDARHSPTVPISNTVALSRENLDKGCRACITCGGVLTPNARANCCPLDGGDIRAGIDPWPGQIVDGKLQIQALLGAGGMGRVYLARHRRIGEMLALKMLYADCAADSTMTQRFTREARSALRIRSPHVVVTHDLGELSNGIPFLTMDYVSGISLSRHLRSQGALTIASTAWLGSQLARGLRDAHAVGVIHRDLKPENVLVARVGNVDEARIADFGLAKIVDQPTDDTALTHAGEVFGTPAFTSPEQARGGPTDERADLYSLGAVLYSARAGRPPFSGNAVQLLMQHLRDEPAPLTDHALDKLILRMLAKDPNRRPSLEEIIRLFDELHNDTRRLTPEGTPLGSSKTTDTRDCLPENLVVALVEGRSSSQERSRAEEHIADCEACAQVVAGLLHRSSQE